MPLLHCDPARLRAERGRPLIFGHRGLPGNEVENRLEAFQAALALGADGVEFDVQLSADGVPMVIHDFRLERTTGSEGKVAGLAAAELEALGLPRLEQVLGALPGTALLNIEIKDFGPRDRGLERKVIGLVRDRDAEERVLFSSFNPLALARIRRVEPRFYTAQLTHHRWPIRALRLGYLWRPPALHPHFREVTPEKVRSWRGRGRRIIVWGADTAAELEAVLRLDIDGVITDRPAEAVRLLADRG